MKNVVLLALLGAVSIWAAKPDYFPLQVGNQWVLQTSSTSPELLTLEVLRVLSISLRDPKGCG